MRDIEEDVCGETYDHQEEVVFEDADIVQWVCTRCGAEGWYDKEPADDHT